MRAVVTTQRRRMELADVPEPGEPGVGEVIVRPRAVGICGSDFHFLLGELGDGSEFPRIQGHEVGATVEALGPGCRDGLAVGDAVALWPLSECGRCYPCRIGRPNVCDNFSLIGIHVDGGLQELLALPDSQVFATSEPNPALASMAEPVSIAVRAVHRAAIESSEHVVVFGAGPIGQAVCLLAGERGASVLLIDPVASRLELGLQTGAEVLAWSEPEEVVAAAREWSGGEGSEVVVDATGAPAAIRAAVDVAVSAGRVVLVGISAHEVSLPAFGFVDKELDVLGASCCQAAEFGEAVAFVEQHGAALERLITHRFPLEDTAQAIEHAIENPAETMKVVIGDV